MGAIVDFAKEVLPEESRWKWLMVIWAAILSAGLWYSFGQIGDLGSELAGVKDSIVCSNLKGQIERSRGDLYEIEREIERANGNVTDRVMRRRAELLSLVEDSERRFVELGCLQYLA